MSDKSYLSWDGMEAACFLLAESIQHNEDIQSVTAIGRGGYPPGVMMSHLLGVPMYTVRASHYDEDGNQEEEVTVYGYDANPPGPTLLFDDIVDTGETMRAVRKALSTAAGTDDDIVTCAINVKPDRNYDPMYWVEETDKWVVYPWESSL